MIKITPAQAKQITKDWNGQFPSLGIYKPLHLLRRCGPLLVGICLNRSSSGNIYKPTFHYHCLLRPFPAVSLSLAVQMKAANGADDVVYVKHHESKLAEAVGKMKAIALLPLDGDITLSQFDAACTAWLKQQLTPCWPNVMEDRVLLHAWLHKDFERPLCEAETALKSWPAFVLEKIGGVAGWLERVRAIAADRDGLETVVKSEIQKLNVSALPKGRFINSSNP